MKIILVLALVLAMSSGSAAARTFEESLAAYHRGDYATALRGFHPLAEQGHVEAQFALGSIYFQGKGVPKDAAEAVKWYRRAAEQGLAIAQARLGEMYFLGVGVPQNYLRAHV